MYAIAITFFIILLMLNCGCMAISCMAVGEAFTDIVQDIIRKTRI